MLDMSTLKEENIRNVTVPLKVDQIKEFFTNKDLVYLVDYKQSELKGVVFLTYLSNLDLPAEINFDGCSYEEKEELIRIYMETRNIISCNTLSLSVAAILLEYRAEGLGNIFVKNGAFSQAGLNRFIENNKELLDRWELFIESTTIYAQSTIEALNDVIQIEKTVPVVEDQQFIGANVVNMFSIPSFYELFLTVNFKHELKYFKFQFQEYMFRGKNFYHYFNTPENVVLKMFLAHINGDINLSMIKEARKDIQAINNNDFEVIEE